jgi:spore coat protein H
MTHNYYLYNDPQTGRLNWISWDHNLVLGVGGGGGGAFNGGQAGPEGGRSNVSFDKSGVGENWPLISYLLSQPEYAQKYHGYLRELTEGVFERSKLIAQIERYAAILAPVATQSDGAYASEVEALKAVVEQRVIAAQEYLASL